jgi:hypothetical protein
MRRLSYGPPATLKIPRAFRHNEAMQDFEKLGTFYLGARYDAARRARKDDLLLYDSKDLVTHAVCVGMTGSGKTGLCIGLIEEAAIDGVPAILIDPKGDLSNLLLNFPELKPEDFLPWINAEEARTAGLTNEQYAAQQAEAWKKGLADWGQDGARIARLRDAARGAVYTPRSSAGLPVSILQSLAAPPPETMEDSEIVRERVNAAASGLLALLGIQGEPGRSREHTLLASLFDHAWRAGTQLDLAALIGQIQTPPFTRLGALDVNSFYPEKERFELAMSLNNLIASPGFNAWLEGEPLDIARLLHTAEGKPQISIFSIAHLDDNERMFFVTLLLNQVLAWMRAQQGTTSLRALLYMDEIFGYFPPVKNPPAKTPLLTLLKQARAYGLGIVLATQNPVDLDYKGLANAGTWWIGRLQTERDKARVLDGLEGAAAESGASFSRDQMDSLLSGLGKRVFLMNNVHERAPVLFQSRWTLSYLRGPLGRDQIKTLMAPLKGARTAALPQPSPAPAAAPSLDAAATGPRPVLPPGVPQYFLAPSGAGEVVEYQPRLIGAAQIQFVDLKRKVDVTHEPAFLTVIEDAAVAVNWDDAAEMEAAHDDLAKEPPVPGTFADLPSAAAQPKSYTAWKRDFTAWLAANRKVTLYVSPSTSLVSEAGESERDFRVRNQMAAREARDQAVEELRRKYAPKLAVLEERLRRAEQVLEREREQAGSQKLETAVTIGASILGALFGRKTLSATNLGRAATAVRSANRARKESKDVGRSGETVEAVQAQINDLETQLQAETAQLQATMDPMNEQLETIEIRPKKTNIAVRYVALAWVPKE